MSKMTIMINKECSDIEKIKKYILDKNSKYEIEFIENESQNLILASDQYIKYIKENKIEKGLIFWITGVAFYNLVSKSLEDKFVFTTQTTNYLEECIENFKVPDFLVMGYEVIGYKNTKPIIDLYLDK